MNASIPSFSKPSENDLEKASNVYLMSLVSILVGLPLPIINLIATLIFYLNNRRSSYFVRWHCTQAMLSQLSTLFPNSIAFWWTVAIVFNGDQITNSYIAYLIVLVGLNIIEFAATVFAAVSVRKGRNVRMWLFGALSDLLCRS